MDAVLHNIEGRRDDPEVWIAGRQRFELGSGESVSSQILLDQPGWWPYAIEPDQRQMIFVQLPPEIDLAQSVFVYETQFEHAQRVLLVPYDLLPELAAQVPEPETLIYIANIGRCGSTLLNQVLNQVPGVWSLSEPDIYTQVGLAAREADGDADVKLALESCTRLLFRPPDPQTRVLSIKPRSQGTFCADLMHDLFPKARYVFMYRDGLTWTRSFHQFIQHFDMPVMPEQEFMAMGWKLLTNESNLDYLKPYLDEGLEAISVEELSALAWAYNMEQYLRDLEAGIPYFALRYNDLIADREATLTALLAHCGLPTDALEAALQGFAQDSQRGTAVAQGQAVPRPFTDDHAARFRAMLARHPRFNDPNILLPDIYHSERRF